MIYILMYDAGYGDEEIIAASRDKKVIDDAKEKIESKVNHNLLRLYQVEESQEMIDKYVSSFLQEMEMEKESNE